MPAHLLRLAAAAALLLPSLALAATTITVTTTAMDTNVDGQCSLPEAMQMVAAVAAPDCGPSGGPPYTIHLGAAQTYTAVAPSNVDAFFGSSLFVVAAQTEMIGNGSTIT